MIPPVTRIPHLWDSLSKPRQSNSKPPRHIPKNPNQAASSRFQLKVANSIVGQTIDIKI